MALTAATVTFCVVVVLIVGTFALASRRAGRRDRSGRDHRPR
jgi:hypothetical protein